MQQPNISEMTLILPFLKRNLDKNQKMNAKNTKRQLTIVCW